MEEVAKALQRDLEIKNKEKEDLSKAYMETKQAFDEVRQVKEKDQKVFEEIKNERKRREDLLKRMIKEKQETAQALNEAQQVM